MNAYLKEIADVCNIHKQLTFHIAIETVSKMLAHKKIQTTHNYAKNLDKKVSNDMLLLRNEYSDDLGSSQLKRIKD